MSGMSSVAAASTLVRIVKKLKNLSDDPAMPARLSPRTKSQYCATTQTGDEQHRQRRGRVVCSMPLN